MTRTCSIGSSTGRTPLRNALLKKMPPKEGAMTARKPRSRSAFGAPSRDEPQPKLRSANRISARVQGSLLRMKSGSGLPSERQRQPANSPSPMPVSDDRTRKRAGMIWSVSMLMRMSGAAMPVSLTNRSMLPSSSGQAGPIDPGPLGAVGRAEGGDLGGAAQGEADLVEPLQEHPAALRWRMKGEDLPPRRGHRLGFEVDGDLGGASRRLHLLRQPAHPLDPEAHPQQPLS